MRSLGIEIDDGGLLKFDPEIEKKEKELLLQLRATNEEIAKRAVDILTTYPPETAGNFPPAPYWERGVGLINSDGKTVQVSEKYGEARDRWRYQTTFGQTEIKTLASTDIPYAPYVGDADLQAWFHAANGWMTNEEVVDFIAPEAQEMMSETLGTAFIDLFTNQ